MTLQRSNNVYLVVAENIRKYRRLKNMSQKDLANKTGYSYSYIRRIEAPKCSKNFSIQTIYNISVALEVPIKYLFEDDNI